MKSSQLKTLGMFLSIATVCLSLAAPACAAAQGNDNRAPEVPAAIQVPDGNRVHFHAYAEGFQIYVWNGSAWVFQAPEAVLFGDAGTHGEIGIHYAGPTWESESGSKVVGARISSAASPNANSIPLLLLRATTAEGPGIFARTSYIQRVNTVGGIAPTAPGAAIGAEARIPYTAEYLFYRRQ